MAHISTPESKHIAGFDYDLDTHVLIVVFKRLNSKYAFYDVPDHIVNALAIAKSKSAFFVKHIKGQYRHKKF